MGRGCVLSVIHVPGLLSHGDQSGGGSVPQHRLHLQDRDHDTDQDPAGRGGDAGHQDSQGGVQGPQPLRPRIIRHDSPGEHIHCTA